MSKPSRVPRSLAVATALVFVLAIVSCSHSIHLVQVSEKV